MSNESLQFRLSTTFPYLEAVVHIHMMLRRHLRFNALASGKARRARCVTHMPLRILLDSLACDTPLAVVMRAVRPHELDARDEQKAGEDVHGLCDRPGRSEVGVARRAVEHGLQSGTRAPGVVATAKRDRADACATWQHLLSVFGKYLESLRVVAHIPLIKAPQRERRGHICQRCDSRHITLREPRSHGV